MCRAKDQGGRRCLRHLRLTQQEAEARAAEWEAKIPEREAIYAARPTAYNRRQLDAAKRIVLVATERAEAESVEIEQREAGVAEAKAAAAAKREAREAARAARAAGTGQRREVATDANGVRTAVAGLAVALTDGEWAKVDAAARRAGHTRQYAEELVPNRSAFVREALGAMPQIGQVNASAFTPVHSEHDTLLGRKPTVSAQVRRGPGITLDGDTLTRLEREAAVFGLTRSDYTRCLLLGLDPRHAGGHESERTSRARFQALAAAEEEAAAQGLSVQEHYARVIGAIRQQVPVVETPIAAGVKRQEAQIAKERRVAEAKAAEEAAKAFQREAELAKAAARADAREEARQEAAAAAAAAAVAVERAEQERRVAEREAEAGRVKAERRAERQEAAWQRKAAKGRAARREKVESDPDAFLTDMRAYRAERAERRAAAGHAAPSTGGSIKGLYEHGGQR